MFLDGIDHVQLAMPQGGEHHARRFYDGVLGVPEVAKPAELAVRGGCWFERGTLRVHLGVEEPFRPARKAHPAFAVLDLDRCCSRLEAAGVEMDRQDGPLGQQVYLHDPFGNRLELTGSRPAAGFGERAGMIVDLARRTGGEELADVIGFALELDRLRTVERRSFVGGGLRRENTAEHSWHVSVLGLVLASMADEPVDAARVSTMLALHDVVEIDAGDTALYDEVGRRDKAERERAAADRLYGLLPAGLGTALRALWDEYEAAETADARFAHSVDRLAPLLLNVLAGGLTWRREEVGAERVRTMNATVAAASAPLGELVDALIDTSVRDGLLDEP